MDESHKNSGYLREIPPAETDKEEEPLALDNLPYEILHIIGGKLDVKELSCGLAQGSHKLNQLFGEKRYWTERLRKDSEYYYKTILQCSEHQLSVVRELYLRYRLYGWENIHRNFTPERIEGHYLGEEGPDQILGNFRCIEFADNGNSLAYVTKDRDCVSVWNIEPLLSKSTSSTPAHLRYSDHDQKVTSLRANANLLSSAAYDGTVAIRDLHHLITTDSPLQRLLSAGLIQSHVWKNNLIATGTRGGTFEVFDTREGEDPYMRDKIFLSTEICNDFKIVLRDSDAILAGWDNGVRKLKLFDLRNNSVLVDAEAGTWNISMSYGDNQLWIGADKGKVLQYNPGNMEIVRDWTQPFGHPANIGWLPDATFWECVRSIIYNSGHVFTADMREVRLHELGEIPSLLWKDEIVFSELAYCEKRSLLAAAVGHTPDQIKLFYPE
ncbi:uncharacterized protein LOC129588654 isoform X2 [Paramacrobiotus metropolitanus]|uniref:uncharacterized protein LOC129588654 isoform X2 n=1 Tax=Paramacrobiotus metropolitanus TaxID=2943436 RepID=UPI002446317C|nr:uncharacterized protein LOC129588654 isoform X2 [Paramacrobiotus metropolitanus]